MLHDNFPFTKIEQMTMELERDMATPYNPQDQSQMAQLNMLSLTATGLFTPLEKRLKLLNARFLSKDVDNAGNPQDRRHIP